VHPPATRFPRAWSEREAPWGRTGAWVAVGVLAVALAVTPLLGGHAAAGPYAAFDATIGVLHFSAAMVATVVTGVPQGWRSGRTRVAWLVGLRVRYPEGRSHLP
jgi:hypothetical protein